MNTEAAIAGRVEENIGLAKCLAAKFPSLDFAEAFSATMDVLWHCAGKYDGGRVPFGAFAAQKMRWRLADMARIRSPQRRNFEFNRISLDAPLLENLTLREVLPAPDAADWWPDDAEFVDQMLARLTSKERQLITDHYLAGVPLTELSERMGFSKARACQIHHQALRKMPRAAWLALKD